MAAKSKERMADPFADWPNQPPEGYRGQLDASFQKIRSELYAGVGLEDCTWYHTTELPDGRLLDGHWDLRERESAYLGDLSLDGKRVLELGPASGYLTFWMERQGAEMTSFEAGYDAVIAMVPPVNGVDLQEAESELMDHTRRTTNAWWYLHRLYGSSARLVHGDIYRMPDDLGTFDVTTLGCILVHTKEPFRVLEQAAQHTDNTIVVTEQFHAGLEGTTDAVMQFGADVANPGPSVGWWQYSPGAIIRMLWRLGFRYTEIVRHSQRYRLPDSAGARSAESPVIELPLFTVIAERADTSRLEELRKTFTYEPEAAVYRRVNGELADAYGQLRREVDAMRSERDAAIGEVAFLRSRPGYRMVDRAHSALQRAPGVYPAAKRLVRRFSK